MRHKRSRPLPFTADLPFQPSARPVRQGPAPKRRFLTVRLPCFRLERHGWSPEDLVMLLEERQNKTIVVALTPQAQAQGARVGMTASEARALVPELRGELVNDPADEAADLLSLAQAFTRLSPAVRPIGQDALAVELTGVTLKGGESGALREALRLARSLGHVAVVVVSDEPLGGLALCSFGEADRVVPVGGLAEALAPLPIDALAPSPRLRERLTLLGLRRVGGLAALDAASVAGRFGEEGLRMHSLAQGRAPVDPPAPPPLAERVSARVSLPSPVESVEALLFALKPLCVRLGARLAALDLATARLQLHLELEDHPPLSLVARFGQPRRDPDDLLALLRRRLETLRLDAPATAIHLDALEVNKHTGQQRGLLDPHTVGGEPLGDLLARLTDALGEHAVFRPALQADHAPERAWCARPFHDRPRPEPPPPPGPSRPTLLWREPRPLTVRRDPEGRILSVQLESNAVVVNAAIGPERLCGGWWSPEPFDRDYHRVELADGRALWIFEDRVTGEFFAHGAWD